MLVKNCKILLNKINITQNVEWLFVSHVIAGERRVYDGLKGKFGTQEIKFRLHENKTADK